MSNELVVLEQQLQPLAPRFAQVLPPSVTPDRLIRTVCISVERLPKLLKCDRQSLFNAAMSAAVLGLEVDGVTGQAFLIPFKDKAQLVVGYKGFNTLGARSGLTLTGGVVREGDKFDYELGTSAFVRHVPLLGKPDRRTIAAWSCATANDRPPIVNVLSIDEILAIKESSPAVKGGADTPWKDPKIGFPAMAEKSSKRRLARSMPLNAGAAAYHLAARLDEAVEERGHAAHLRADGNMIIDGEVLDQEPQPDAAALMAPHRPGIPSELDYVAKWDRLILNATSAEALGSQWNGEKAIRDQMTWSPDDTFKRLHTRVARAVEAMKAPA
jgi:recombination protein RecT